MAYRIIRSHTTTNDPHDNTPHTMKTHTKTRNENPHNKPLNGKQQ